MSHALLIAAVFIPYVALMIGLGAYIWHTGRPRRDDSHPGVKEEDRGDHGPSVLPIAA